VSERTSILQGLRWPVGSDLAPSEALDRHEACVHRQPWLIRAVLSCWLGGPAGSASCPAPGSPPCSWPCLCPAAPAGLNLSRVTHLSQGPSPSPPLPNPRSSGGFCPSDPSDTHSNVRRVPGLLPGMGSPSLLSGLETNSNPGSRQCPGFKSPDPAWPAAPVWPRGPQVATAEESSKLSVHPLICPPTPNCPSFTHPAIHPPSHPASQPSIHLAIHPSTHTAIHPPIHPAIHPPSHPSTQPSIHLAIHPSSQPASQPSIHPPTQPSTHPST